MVLSDGRTDIGCSRTSNEDAFAVEPELGLYLLADGMGGAQAGERASGIAIETIVRCVREAAPSRTMEGLLGAIRVANQEVMAQAAANLAYQGMGTTVVALLVDLPAAHVASVGDSRVYLWRRSQLERVTSDQTWVNEVGRSLGLSEEQIHSHPFRNVLTMAVGSREGIEVHSHELTLEAGDRLLLSSDGLHGVVPETGLRQALGASKSLSETTAELIQMARRAGGPDNITAVVVEVQ